MSITSQIQSGLNRAFIDREVPASESLTPSLVYNDAAEGNKVYCSIQDELDTCKSFWFSVAFITQSGLQLLKTDLKEMEKRGIPGKILTTDYLCFSDPKALDFLSSFSNLEVRMFLTNEKQKGFHTKGYFFEHEDSVRVIVGSSNLTDSALTVNEEWNTRLISEKDGEFIYEIDRRFHELFDDLHSVPYENYRETYLKLWEESRKQKKLALSEEHFSLKQYALKPNEMQMKFIENLRKMMEEGKKRALLVSATGTGKTYAAAFAVREIRPQRLLFLVHREKIARQALQSFRTVIGPDKTYGLVGGGKKQLDRDYIFSTIQTLSRKDTLHSFRPDEFDMIIIDEVHHAAASSYKKIFDYFHPAFWLGMSATPDRTDHENIYELFDYNVPLKISLRDALELDLLCPFHYYALSDLQVDDESIKDLHRFNDLVSDQRIDHILDEASYYGYSGDRVRGLMFVSSVNEAKALSKKLNERGLRTMALSGEDDPEKRERAIERLVRKENDEQALDYLITVDIFNEGVDIPEVNQVLLLRPTQSAIVFVQQLGRGLRKSDDKDFVVVLDFIGLYANNYMIPEALSENKDGSKDRLRRFVFDGTRTLPGKSTVYFDEVSRKRIFQSIEQAKMNSSIVLKEGWMQLKDKLGRIPDLVDFDVNDAIDPLLIFSNNNYPSYPDFLRKILKAKEREQLPHYEETDLQFLRFVSGQWANGKRLPEILAVQAMMEDPDHWEKRFRELCEINQTEIDEKTWKNLEAQFTRNWLRGTGAGTSPDAVFLEKKDGHLAVTGNFRKALEHSSFKKALTDLIQFAVQRYDLKYRDLPKDGWLILNEKYPYMDSFRNMDFEVSQIPNNVGGYTYNESTNQFPVYINYDKAEDIAESMAYEDHFTSPNTLVAFSKSRRNLDSKEIERLRHFKENHMTIPLFVRKNTRDDLKEFYYLGRMRPTGSFEEITMKDGKTRGVKIEYELEHPVRADLYDYMTRS